MKNYSYLRIYIMSSMLLICLLTVYTATAQEETEPISTDFSFGFQLNEYQQDFGFGLQTTSPYFLHDKLAFRARANIMFLQHLDANGTYTWTPYSNYTLGIIGSGARVMNIMHLYGEGGVIMINPSETFSSEGIIFGGYGLFGFEFYFFSHGNYFIELGGIGGGGSADEVVGTPIYSNGFSISTGFRFFL